MSEPNHVAITLYVDSSSAEGDVIERELRAILTSVPQELVHLEVRNVGAHIDSADATNIAITPILIVRGPRGRHVRVGRLDRNDLRQLLLSSGIQLT